MAFLRYVRLFFVNVICGGTGFMTASGSGALIRALDADRARSWKEEALRAERVEYQSTVWSDRENVRVQAGRDQAVSGVVVVVVSPRTNEGGGGVREQQQQQQQ